MSFWQTKRQRNEDSLGAPRESLHPVSQKKVQVQPKPARRGFWAKRVAGASSLQVERNHRQPKMAG